MLSYLGYNKADRSYTDSLVSILDNRGRHDVIHNEPQKQRAHCAVSRNQHISQLCSHVVQCTAHWTALKVY